MGTRVPAKTGVPPMILLDRCTIRLASPIGESPELGYQEYTPDRLLGLLSRCPSRLSPDLTPDRDTFSATVPRGLFVGRDDPDIRYHEGRDTVARRKLDQIQRVKDLM